MGRTWMLMACVALTASMACKKDKAAVCVVGTSQACAGTGGCAGFQVCRDDGAGFGACDCSGGPSDAGTTPDAAMSLADAAISDAANHADAALSPDASETPDGAIHQDASATPDGSSAADAGSPDAATLPDAGAQDAAPPVDAGTQGICNALQPAGMQGCEPGFKCGWVADVNGISGATACAPDGTVDLGGACNAPMPGPDNCRAGLVCINARCRGVCAFPPDTPACASGSTCTAHHGLFTDAAGNPWAGACVPSCDPLTQLTSEGTPCGTGLGCYLVVGTATTSAVCASAGTVQHNVEITGTTYANVCVPGAQVRTRGTGLTGYECGGLCRPANVYQGQNEIDEGGVAPDSCEARWGAAPPSDSVAGESCRYWWAREPFEMGSAYSNHFGFCFKHAAFQYDTNGDGTPDAPFPRCPSLTTGDVVPPIENPPHNDAQYFWCMANPAAPPVPWAPTPRNTRLQMQGASLDRVGNWRR